MYIRCTRVIFRYKNSLKLTCVCVLEEKVKQIKTKTWLYLSIQEEERLSQKVKEYPALFDKQAKGYKQKDIVNNAQRKVAEALDFTENGKLHFKSNHQSKKYPENLMAVFQKKEKIELDKLTHKN